MVLVSYLLSLYSLLMGQCADQMGLKSGYIIKDEGISVCMSSKHLQTRRLLHTLKAYLLEIQRILIQMWKEANERPVTSFIDHFGILRDARTGKPINMEVEEEEGKEVGEEVLGGFGFFDVGAQNQTPQSRRRKALVGKTLSIAEY